MNTAPVRGFRRGRMTTTGHMAQIGDISTVSRTPAEAKADVLAKAEDALSGSYTPVLLRYGMHAAIVWREPTWGWTYRMLDTTSLPDEPEYNLSGCSSSDADRATTVRRVKYHLAQNAYDPISDCATPTPGVRVSLDSLFAFVDPADHSEMADWIGFQRAYQNYKTRVAPEAFNSSEAHDYACSHSRDEAPRY